jgi:DNA-binding response OmpR family regulator
MNTGEKTNSGPEPIEEAERKSSKPQAQTARKIILVVDDNLVLQKTIASKLKVRGYDVIIAEDGSAAATAVGRLKPDLILMDVNFPPDVSHGGGLAWDGFLIVRWLRRTREAEDVPVIGITGDNLELHRQHAKDAGMLDLFAKPLDYDLLVAKIREVLNQGELEAKYPPAPPPPSFESARRILFVDDESPWRQMATTDLFQQGYEVVTADTGETALIEAARTRPDLMILDLKLEKDTGLKVMTLLLAAHPSVPLLVYAGLGIGEEGKHELMNLGVFDILQKRTMEELQAAVRLASHQPRPKVEAKAARSEATPPEAKIPFDTVLVVEDDPTFRDLLRSYLESESFYVTCVSNATEALRQMASADFDLIVTDMVLKGHSGEDFYHEVERGRPDLCRRFIFMTGHEAERRTDDFIRRVHAIMLWKPFPLADLLSATETVRRKDRLARALARCGPLISA